MSHAETLSGQCLCGAVSFTVASSARDVTVCHCGMCRRWSGGIALFLPETGRPGFVGAHNISVFRSSEWGERAFCRICGSNLYWKLAGEERYVIAAGVLDDQTRLKLTTEIFIEDKPGYYDFANETEKHQGEVALSAFMGLKKSESE